MNRAEILASAATSILLFSIACSDSASPQTEGPEPPPSTTPPPPDDPDGPPSPEARVPPEPGDVLLYLRTSVLTDVITIGGQTSFKRRYDSFELNLTADRVGRLFSSYSKFNDQSFPDIAPLTLDGRLFEVSDDSELGSTLIRYSEKSPRTLETLRSVRVSDDRPVQAIAAWGDHIYFTTETGLARVRLAAATSGRVPLEPFAIAPPEPILDGSGPCRSSVQLGSKVYCTRTARPTAQTLCTDSCTTANNGRCHDGGRGANPFELPKCAFGTDCADCGSRTYNVACFDTCPTAGNGRCEDGDLLSENYDCRTGTDCADCGERYFEASDTMPAEALTLVIDEIDLEQETWVERWRGASDPFLTDPVYVDGDTYYFVRFPHRDDPIETRFRRVEVVALQGASGPQVVLATDVPDPEVASAGPRRIRVLDSDGPLIVFEEQALQRVEVWDLRSPSAPLFAGGLGDISRAAIATVR